MLSDVAVRRPVLATVMAIILCVVGVAAFFALPVRELPNVDPPQVSITTTFVGASAEVIEERITQVIEQQVAGIQGVDRITSSSRDGASQISILFTLDRNLDEAANDVRDAVSRVLARLPDDADPPTIAKANADSSPLIFLTLSSNTMNGLELADYANRYMIQRLSTVPGVAQVFLAGAQLYSMRIWLNPDAMAAHGITVEDVDNALQAQNVELPAGALESTANDYTVRVNRLYVTPEQFAQMPVTPARVAPPQANGSSTTMATTASSAAEPANYVVRLGDIARVEEGPNDRRRIFRSNGANEIGFALTRQSQANDLQISQGVKDAIAQINPTLPPGAHLDLAVDYTVFTSRAIHEVWVTMALSLILVAIVNMLFLGDWRAAVIPAVVAPISIVSTFIVLAPLGFSINLLTLLALVLAIGLVVDDAIVVVENIQRRVDEGEPPLLAAERGARQVFFAVVATTIVLISVFAPLMFLPGYIGRLFVELAVAIAAAVAFSAFLALSLSPMLGSKLLRPTGNAKGLARIVDTAMTRLRASYHNSLDLLLEARAAKYIVGGGLAVLAALAVVLFFLLPQELVPPEDRGRVDIQILAPEGSGYDYTLRTANRVEPILQHLVQTGVADRYILGVPRYNSPQYNIGFGSLVLHDWDERKQSAQQVAAGLNKQFNGITSARVLASLRGPFQRGGGGSGNNVDLIVEGNDYPQLARWVAPILDAALSNPGLVRPRLDYQPTSPRLIVDIDRDKAATLGVSTQEIGDTLQTMLGSDQVTTYVKNGQQYDVILQTDLDQRRTLADLERLQVRGSSGALIPLSNVVKTSIHGDTPNRARVDRQRAITLTAELAPGYTVAKAVQFYRDQAARNPVAGISIDWGGQARDYLQAAGGVGLAFALALVLVFLVLAGQFESWINPGIIMMTVPLAALGGLFGLLMAGSTVNTYSEIGLIILIGIAAKNGILIVEFANQLRDEGRSVADAVKEAASLRLRPIVMTSIAAACGALPLVFANGPGAGSRQTIGVVIFSGAIFATAITLFALPVLYNLLAGRTKSPHWTAQKLKQIEDEAEAKEHGGAPAAAE
ncbi:MAG: efflux RND transporter permease subunit [Pseudomonadota bacterium]